MKRRVIAIIGGGPAGSTTALELITSGIDPQDIVIYDRAVFPRQKLCGGAVTFRGLEHLRRYGITTPEICGGCQTSGLELESPFGRLDVCEPGPQMLFDRAALDQHLLNLCRTAGVEIREGEKVSGLEPGVDGWRVFTKDRRYTAARWIVGADGAAGVTRKAAALKGGRVGRLIEAVFESSHSQFSADTLYFTFDPVVKEIPGYGWVFPYPGFGGSKTGGGKLWKVGIMDYSGRVPGVRLRQWVQRHAERHELRMVDEKITGWPEHYYSWRNEVHRPGLVLVGEAHGVDPLLGEGITPAFATAKFAATKIKWALDHGLRTLPFYEKRFAATEEGRNLIFQGFVASYLYGPEGHYWLRRFFQSQKIREHGALGKAAYGRLLRRAPDLIWAIAKRRR